jgi:hypothetical protein
MNNLPSLEAGTPCPECNAPRPVSGYCGVCEDRLALESRIANGNDYRRDAQFRLDMERVRERARKHLRRERAEAFDRFREDAEEFMQNAAWADNHSSDVDPGTGRE